MPDGPVYFATRRQGTRGLGDHVLLGAGADALDVAAKEIRARGNPHTDREADRRVRGHGSRRRSGGNARNR